MVPAAGVVAEAMVMLTLATFVLEKFGGDTVGRRPGRAGPLPGTDRVDTRGARRRRPARPAEVPATHGLSGTDEAGSGGDD